MPEMAIVVTPKIIGSICYQCAVTDEMVEDILHTAFEVGIGEWCSAIVKVSPIHPSLHKSYPAEYLAKGGVLKLRADNVWYAMTLATFLSGMGRHCQEKGWPPEEMHEQHDCEDADIIVQYALFGELRYA